MLIGLNGKAKSGKDTSADIIVNKYGFVKMSLADPLKRFCFEVFDFSEEQLWGASEHRNELDMRYPIKDGYLSPRIVLQQLGTEWGREMYPDIWVNYAIKVAKALNSAYENKDNLFYNGRDGLYTEFSGECPYKGVIISDCRFKNELAGVRNEGGILIRVKRKASGIDGELGNHVSEVEMEDVPDSFFDFVIENDGSLQDLNLKIEKIMDKYT